ncbi:MAG: NUDIX domain-containing protein [Corynebacteriales bacterium]|uniref:NUDIX domain-containing protein n=1 Tax=Williamsia herbipolensis TaxID=1603258 RepID=A0AAU4K1L1_9NOCA|nr:NUDIX domain-containing protein [Williamsia herbipolensis]MCX6469201.1 NUDIX domain-containing protein [Mycobacteriales bacterium]
MPRRSAGLLIHRGTGDGIEVLLGHPGGPFYARKDDGSWSIPKGEYTDEDPLDAARREFVEEVGIAVPDGPAVDLGEVRQSSGKIVTAWAVAGDIDVTVAVSNTFEMEWPPRSGTLQSFPEIDRVAWFDLQTADTKILASQRPFLERLRAAVG